MTITPAGTAGTRVNGVLLVETFSAYVGSGDELARLPYRYSIAP